jgi:hypothetical protein
MTLLGHCGLHLAPGIAFLAPGLTTPKLGAKTCRMAPRLAGAKLLLDSWFYRAVPSGARVVKSRDGGHAVFIAAGEVRADGQ